MTDQSRFHNERRAPRVAVFGDWGETNLGDWAIHEGVLAFFDGFASAVDCYQCGALRPFGRESNDRTEKAQAGRSIAVTDQPPPQRGSTALRRLKRSIRGIRQEFLMHRLMPRLAAADLICVGGGALLTDINLHFPQSLAVIQRAAAELRKPLWCLGCSAEGEWSDRGRAILADFVAACDVIAVRDRATAERVTELAERRVPVFGDFALPLAPWRGRRRVRPREYLLGINVSHIPQPWTHFQQDYEDLLVELAQRFSTFSGPDMKIALFTTGTRQDDAPAMRVHQRLAPIGATLHRPRDLGKLRRVMDESEVVLATRLHAAIVALAEGRPAISVSPAPKTENFFDTIGLSKYSFRVPAATSDQLMACIGDRGELDRQWQAMDHSECARTRDQVLARLMQLGSWPLAAS